MQLNTKLMRYRIKPYMDAALYYYSGTAVETRRFIAPVFLATTATLKDLVLESRHVEHSTIGQTEKSLFNAPLQLGLYTVSRSE
jgi:hypothetical protein